MLVRIASVALTLLVLAACGREPQEPARTPPATGESAQQADRSAAGDRTGTQQTQPTGSAASGQPAQGGQHYESRAGSAGVRDYSEGMSEEERQEALRACERLEAAERERCETEVRERANPQDPQREGQR